MLIIKKLESYFKIKDTSATFSMQFFLLLFFIFLTPPIFVVYAEVAGEKANDQPKSDIEVTVNPVHTIEVPAGTHVEPKGFRLGPGMEIIAMNGTNIYLPRGATVRKEHGVIYCEDIGEFLARRFDDIDKRLKQIEYAQEETKKEVQQLKKAAEENNKSSLSSK